MSDQDTIVGSDKLDQTHPLRAAQTAATPEQHQVAASFHMKRSAELDRAGVAAHAHALASSAHAEAVWCLCDAHTTAAKAASKEAAAQELAETGNLGQMCSTEVADVETCGDLPGHPFRGNQHAEAAEALAKRGEKQARAAENATSVTDHMLASVYHRIEAHVAMHFGEREKAEDHHRASQAHSAAMFTETSASSASARKASIIAHYNHSKAA